MGPPHPGRPRAPPGPLPKRWCTPCCTTWPACRPGPWCYSHRKSEMRQAVDALPSALRSKVLVQNTMPRFALLNEHREQVEAGQAFDHFWHAIVWRRAATCPARCAPACSSPNCPLRPRRPRGRGPGRMVAQQRAQSVYRFGCSGHRHPLGAMELGGPFAPSTTRPRCIAMTGGCVSPVMASKFKKACLIFRFQQRFAQLAHN